MKTFMKWKVFKLHGKSNNLAIFKMLQETSFGFNILLFRLEKTTVGFKTMSRFETNALALTWAPA